MSSLCSPAFPQVRNKAAREGPSCSALALNLHQQITLLYLHKISNICFSLFSTPCPAFPLLCVTKQTFAPSLQFFGFPASLQSPPSLVWRGVGDESVQCQDTFPSQKKPHKRGVREGFGDGREHTDPKGMEGRADAVLRAGSLPRSLRFSCFSLWRGQRSFGS